jgi:hypothetical protein
VLCSITPPTHPALLNDDPGLCRNPPIKTGPVLKGGQVKSGGTGDFSKRKIADILFNICYKNNRG